MPITTYSPLVIQPSYTDIAEAEPEKPDRLLSHYLSGTERKPYYTCKWCFVEIKTTYFKYLKHRGVPKDEVTG